MHTITLTNKSVPILMLGNDVKSASTSTDNQMKSSWLLSLADAMREKMATNFVKIGRGFLEEISLMIIIVLVHSAIGRLWPLYCIHCTLYRIFINKQNEQKCRYEISSGSPMKRQQNRQRKKNLLAKSR